MYKTDKKNIFIILLIILSLTLLALLFYFKNVSYKSGRVDGFSDKISLASESLKLAIEEKYKDKKFVNKYVKSIKIENSEIEFSLDKKFSSIEEFDKTLRRINSKGIEILSVVNNLDKEDKNTLYSIFDTIHSKTIQKEYKVFLQILKQKKFSNYESVLEREYYNTSKALSEYLSENTCATIMKVFSIGSLSVKNIDLTSIIVTQPCKILMESLIKPFESELIALGIGKDYDKSIHRIKNHIRTSVLELSTVSDDQSSYQHIEKEAGSTLGRIFSGKAEMSVSYVGRVKAGYKLDKYFEIKFDHKNEILQVFLPKAEILSTEIHTDVKKIEEDWSGFIEIDANTINYYTRLAREEIVEKAIRNGLLEDAQKNAVAYISTMFMPFYSLPDREYKFEIYFQNKKYKNKKFLD